MEIGISTTVLFGHGSLMLVLETKQQAYYSGSLLSPLKQIFLEDKERTTTCCLRKTIKEKQCNATVTR